jgi:MFS family permease
MMTGYDQGLMGSIISTPYFLEAMKIKLTDANTFSTIVSIYDIGCMIGCIAATFLGVRLGRKTMITIGLSIMIVGAIIQAS